ncbi:MAG: tryptophan synthase subunit alpha, partial [Deltaproteobacteria bacterium]|nr:tryptophan synthase subunit alpha [Deltaproteobacteria bacterium]
MTESVLTKAILAARDLGRPALIPFLTGGYPDRPRFLSALADLDRSGADVIEIGVPFSDPVADGPVVAAAGLAALEGGVDLKSILADLTDLRLRAPLVLMSYANPLVQYAWDRTPPGDPLAARVLASLRRLAQAAKEARIAGFIVPDVPLEEAGPFHAALSEAGLDLIPLVGPNTTLERMREYSAVAGGYAYVVSVLGTTGVREGLPPETLDTLARAREAFRLPLALGFGLQNPSQLTALGARPDAVIIGSALLKHLAGGGSAAGFLAPWTS